VTDVAIETERLLLRRPRPDDLDDFAAAFSDPEVMQFLGDGSTVTREQTEASIRRWLERWDADGIGLCSMEIRATGQVAGRTGFLVWDTADWTTSTLAGAGERAEVEIGWTVAREYWGNGYATEAALALRDWGVAERGLSRLISLIRPDNVRSVRVAEKIGESFEREIALMGQPALLYSMQA